MRIEIAKKDSCRVCKSNKLTKVLSFGPSPLANAFLSRKQYDLAESFYPLDVYFCNDCTFLQLGHVVNPEILFGNYVYVSSTSPVFVRHFEVFADEVISRFNLKKNSLVIDIGSNDGILLKPYKASGLRVLGVEPAKHIARLANKSGIKTIADWFTVKTARKIIREHGQAKVITGTNVFAHIDNLDEVLQAVNLLLEKNGVFITESPYLMDFLEKKYFDLVYHEHLSYWAIKPLLTLFRRFDMEIIDIRKVPVHGGSVRVFAAKAKSIYKKEQSVNIFLQKEKKSKLDKCNTYILYKMDILKNREKLISLLTTLKLKKAKIAGYGAPAKGTTLLNYFKIGADLLDYIVDDSPFKYNLYTPGTRIPVVTPAMLHKDKPDYLLILAWNFAGPIMEKHNWFKKRGGKFILPAPKPLII